jgi:hypothetical protein
MNTERISRWIQSIIRICAVVLLCLLCVLVFKLTVLVQRIDDGVAGMASSAKQVASGAASVAQKIYGLDSFADRVAELLPDIALGERPPSEDKAAEGNEEITYLLSRISEPGLRYEYGKGPRDSAWVYTKLSLKYRLRRSAIGSAEDFIREVATRTHDGSVYYVIDKAGNKKELAAWLSEILAERRSLAPKPP